MHWKSGLLSPEKVSSHSTTQLFFLCGVFLCFHTTGCEAYSFMTDGYGILNARTDVGACHTHEGGSSTIKSAQELAWRDRKTAAHLAPPGIEPRVFRFEI